MRMRLADICSAVLFNSYQIPTNSDFFWTTNPLNISNFLCVTFLHALRMHPSGFALSWSLAYLTANFVPYNWEIRSCGFFSPFLSKFQGVYFIISSVCVCVCAHACVHAHMCVALEPGNYGSSWWVTENSWQYPACWTSSNNHDLLRGDRLLHGDVVLVGGHGTCRLWCRLWVAPLGWWAVASLGGGLRDGTIPLLWLVHCNVQKNEDEMVWLPIKGNN